MKQYLLLVFPAFAIAGLVIDFKPPIEGRRRAMTEEILRNHFLRQDNDKDGKILLPRYMQDPDTDQDAHATLDEYLLHYMGKFDQADTNHDHILTVEEERAFRIAHPSPPPPPIEFNLAPAPIPSVEHFFIRDSQETMKRHSVLKPLPPLPPPPPETPVQLRESSKSQTEHDPSNKTEGPFPDFEGSLCGFGLMALEPQEPGPLPNTPHKANDLAE